VVSTPVVELQPDVLERLEEYVAEFARGFGYITRARWAGVYLQGLFLNGERKSIEPLSRRVSVPAGTAIRSRRCSSSSTRTRGTQAVLQTYRRVMGEAL
jgi:SRSO17 transposase